MEQANLKSYTRIWVGRSRRHPRHARPEISHPGPPAPRVPTPKTHTHTTHLASSQKISGRLGFRCACAHRKTRPPSPPPPPASLGAAAAAARRACSPKCREAAGIGEPMVAVARGRRCRGVVLLLLLASVLAPLVLYGGSPVSVSTLPDSTGTNGRMPPSPPPLSLFADNVGRSVLDGWCFCFSFSFAVASGVLDRDGEYDLVVAASDVSLTKGGGAFRCLSFCIFCTIQ